MWSVYFTDNNTGYAVGNFGTIIKTIDGGGVVSVDDEQNSENTPKSYLLEQNYPNPFNPSTKINYQVPEISFVTLKVYDVLGNEITSLVNEEKPAGEYNVEFRIDNFELEKQ